MHLPGSMKPIRVSITLGAITMAAGGVAWHFSHPANPVESKARSAITRQGGTPVSIMDRLMAGGIPQLTPEQIARYVESQNRSAMSLAAASTLSGDEAWLREAVERFPDDPRVALAMVIRHPAAPESAEWIKRLKRVDPDNALGPLLGAKMAFEGNNPQSAMAELAALETLTRTDLHTADWKRAMTDAYQSAGFQGLEAEWAGMIQVPLPMGELSGLSRAIAEAMISANGKGDRQTAERLGKLGLRAATIVGSRGEQDLLVTQLVSVSMERKMLDQLHVFDLIPGDTKLVADRLGEMDKRIAHIKDLVRQHAELAPTMTPSELRQFTRRMWAEGELKAMEWLAARRRGP